MADGRFVTYLRVSTQQQGASGLGIEAQKTAVTAFLNGGKHTVVKEFVEVESGKRADRPVLAEAITLAKRRKATLIIAKLDRLARNVAFISNLMESGVEFVAVDMPQANKFTSHIMAAVAQQEAEAISRRTTDALAAAKARGTVLGGRRVSEEAWTAVARTGRAAAAKVRSQNAKVFRDSILPIVHEIQAAGVGTYAGIAFELNSRGETTRRGQPWSAAHVHLLLSAAQKDRLDQAKLLR